MPRILISGASGLIGSALIPLLESKHCEVTRLVRQPAHGSNELQWDPTRTISPQLVSGFDAVIHLSGESVTGRWTAAKKRAIRDSRIVSTKNLSQAMASAEKEPSLFLCASAIGYYGSRGDEILSEDSAPGSGFLAEITREWEAATEAASDAGVRVVNLRIGIVLSRSGGALQPMLVPFRFGLGGRIGSGRQWWSWIHIEDLIAAVWHLLRRVIDEADTPLSEGASRAPESQESSRHPANLVAPNPVTNADFTRTLAEALRRPAFIPVPAFAAKLAFGEFADEGPLASARVLPKALRDSQFEFRFPRLPEALADLLTRR